MKKRRVVCVAGFACLALIGLKVLADEVTPANLKLYCKRTTASSAAVTNITYYQGDTLSLTNSVMYTDATGAATQNLDGCVITVTAGQPGNTSVTTAVGYNIDTNAGTWGAEFTVPAFNPCYIQVSVSNNAIFTYPLYRVTTQAKLGD